MDETHLELLLFSIITVSWRKQEVLLMLDIKSGTRVRPMRCSRCKIHGGAHTQGPSGASLDFAPYRPRFLSLFQVLLNRLVLYVWPCFIWMFSPIFVLKNFKATEKLKEQYKKYSVHLLPSFVNCQCLGTLTISPSVDLTLNLVLMHQRNHVPSIQNPPPRSRVRNVKFTF